MIRDHRFPLSLERIAALAAGEFGAVIAAEPLSGDASTRRFIRIRLAGGGSSVAMVLDGPVDPAIHPQFIVGAYLESLGLPVPHLLCSLPDAGILFYEDIGDLLLQDLAGEVGLAAGAWGHWDGRGSTGEPEPVSHSGPSAARGSSGVGTAGAGADHGGSMERLEQVYEDAVALIVELQGEATRRLPAGHPSSASALDADRFLYELRFFREHYIDGLHHLSFGPREGRLLDEFLGSLAHEAAARPWVLCHRDYHSRNLLVQGKKLRVVDFQDARLGPVAYDLASLLRDSYVALPEELRGRLFERFVRAGGDLVGDPALFRERFDVVALQRNLKAIGTFAYQAVARGKSGYLTYIGPTWGSIFDALQRLPRWAEIVPILEASAAVEPDGSGRHGD